MTDIYYTLAGFVTITIGIVVLVVQALKSNSLLSKLGQSQSDVADAIQSYKTVVDSLPRRVSQDLSREVRDGIDPTRQELEKLSNRVNKSTEDFIDLLEASHSSLIKTLATVNVDGALSDWVGSLRETIDPLQAATSALESHYETSERILDKTGELIYQWTSQRQVVENAFTKFSATIEAWAAAETTNLQNIEPRILERLEEVSRSNHLVASGLSSLETSQTILSDSQKDLSENIRRISLDFASVIDNAKQNQEGHKELVRRQAALQEQLKTLQSETQLRGEQFERQTKEALNNLVNAQSELISDIRKYVQNLFASINKFNEWQQKSMEGISTQHNALIKSQQEIIAELNKLIPRVEDQLLRLPTSKAVNLGVWLLAIQIIMTGVIAYGILFKQPG